MIRRPPKSTRNDTLFPYTVLCRSCKPVTGELTYGLERLAMNIQGVDNVYDLAFYDEGVTYGDVFLENERQFSKWNFEVADTEKLFQWFRDAEAECKSCIEKDLPLPA